MSWLRPLGNTGIAVSALGLGTVKFGRNQGLKYPRPFALPDDSQARELLDRARELGVNLLDTAPAYGDSEARLGRLLAGRRRDWVICTKVGEEFHGGVSHFDFSPEYTRRSVEASLQRLATDVIDIVLVHSDGDDLAVLEQGTVEALKQMQGEGLLRAVGFSAKTVAGGVAAARVCDVVMLEYSPNRPQGTEVLAACAELGRGALVKKALGSGHLGREPQRAAGEALAMALAQPGVSSVVVGTLSCAHLADNVAAAREAAG